MTTNIERAVLSRMIMMMIVLSALTECCTFPLQSRREEWRRRVSTIIIIIDIIIIIFSIIITIIGIIIIITAIVILSPLRSLTLRRSTQKSSKDHGLP